jgi:hypothetical protein
MHRILIRRAGYPETWKPDIGYVVQTGYWISGAGRIPDIRCIPYSGYPDGFTTQHRYRVLKFCIKYEINKEARCNVSSFSKLFKNFTKELTLWRKCVWKYYHEISLQFCRISSYFQYPVYGRIPVIKKGCIIRRISCATQENTILWQTPAIFIWHGFNWSFQPGQLIMIWGLNRSLKQPTTITNTSVLKSNSNLVTQRPSGQKSEVPRQKFKKMPAIIKA